MSVPYWVALRLCFENTFTTIRAQELEFQMRWCKIETILAVVEIGKTGLFSGFLGQISAAFVIEYQNRRN